ncbi:MAG: bifunctional folylpolyglutamate synthase/dihydrofolate synthase [Rhodospirillales bacterium]|nr:bifunctional folylpolyglutamate synthase/dihydrofolate synthase [Rhodospirillales bacterium]
MPSSVTPSSSPVLDRLTRLHPKAIDLSLERIERLMDRLGRPQDHLPPVVHVAGTNGKGSLVAFLRAMLEASGYRAHAYTSPHLVRFTERIVVGGGEIADAALSALLEECEAANAGEPITLFEITTVAAFLAFARSPADVTLLETGLGGRLDATNVVPAPRLTVLTPISLDHESYLGDTLAAIASEKAGILKHGVACVTAAQPPDAAATISARAARVGTRLFIEGVDWRIEQSGADSFVYSDADATIVLPAPTLIGAHQRRNAGLAVACARRLPGLSIGAEALARGVRRAQWPARLQRLEAGRLRRILPDDWELWLDGGHNPGAAQVLAQHLEGWSDRPLFVIYGMLRSKHAAGFLAPLARRITRLAAVAIPGESASLTAEEAAELAIGQGCVAVVAASVADALRTLSVGYLTDGHAGPARVLICGSLYLAGAVLSENNHPAASAQVILG